MMIELKNIKLIFDSRGIAGLHGLDLSVREGEIFSVMGPNGCGKTTLLKIVHGGLQGNGTVRVHGKIQFFRPSDVVTDKSVEKFLISNVEAILDEEKKIQLARELADVFEFTAQFRQNVNQLSSGQRQKVFVAAELIKRPDVLLMDEPFSHLDPLGRHEVLQALFTYIRRHSMTVLWVTHEREEAFKFSDRIGIMNFGKWEQTGLPADVIKSPRNLFTAQFIGYRNFLSVKYEAGWVTPWGRLDLAPKETGEAILVMTEAWSSCTEGPLFKLVESYPSARGIHCELEALEQKFFALFSYEDMPDFSRPVHLRPDVSRAFLISW
jgi:ABC-type Fe3+/spermidine/putrescine transport system ATPase subunit